MKGIYNKNSKLDFGMYEGYELGTVYIFDPAYIDWCINNINRFHITDLDELKEIGIVNNNLNWQYRMIGDPSLIPNINIFETFQEYLENVKFGDKKYIFNEETLNKNASKADNFSQDYWEENESYYTGEYYEDNEGYYGNDDYEDNSICPACGESEYMCCNYWIERNS